MAMAVVPVEEHLFGDKGGPLGCLLLPPAHDCVLVVIQMKTGHVRDLSTFWLSCSWWMLLQASAMPRPVLPETGSTYSNE